MFVLLVLWICENQSPHYSLKQRVSAFLPHCNILRNLSHHNSLTMTMMTTMMVMMTTMMTYPGGKVFPTGQAGTLLLGGTAKAEAATSSLGF